MRYTLRHRRELCRDIPAYEEPSGYATTPKTSTINTQQSTHNNEITLTEITVSRSIGS